MDSGSLFDSLGPAPPPSPSTGGMITVCSASLVLSLSLLQCSACLLLHPYLTLPFTSRIGVIETHCPL